MNKKVTLTREVRYNRNELPGPYTMEVDISILKQAVEAHRGSLEKSLKESEPRLTDGMKATIDGAIQKYRDIFLFLESYPETENK